MSAKASILNLLGAAKNHLGVWLPDTQGSLNFHDRSLLESLEARNELSHAELRRSPQLLNCKRQRRMVPATCWAASF
jgi:hypothetical protein